MFFSRHRVSSLTISLRVNSIKLNDGLSIMNKRALCILYCLLCVGCATRHPIKLGDDATVIIVQEKHGEGKNFIHVHQNERTALRAARIILKREGGSLLTLEHRGGRNITFRIAHERYEFDPNRIFTAIGIKKTLMELSHYTPEAQREVEKLADKIKELLPPGKIIAVHNNETYSLKNYLPGADLAHDALFLYVNSQHYYRNFYLVTRESDFRRFKQLQFNSICQAPQAEDDGSLSVFLANRDYINVEAGYDQLAMQVKMLQYA